MSLRHIDSPRETGILVRGQDHKKEMEYADDLITFLRNTNRELEDLLYVQKRLDDGKAQKPSPGTSRVL